jgi:hypothetical protein
MNHVIKGFFIFYLKKINTYFYRTVYYFDIIVHTYYILTFLIFTCVLKSVLTYTKVLYVSNCLNASFDLSMLPVLCSKFRSDTGLSSIMLHFIKVLSSWTLKDNYLTFMLLCYHNKLIVRWWWGELSWIL